MRATFTRAWLALWRGVEPTGLEQARGVLCIFGSLLVVWVILALGLGLGDGQ